MNKCYFPGCDEVREETQIYCKECIKALRKEMRKCHFPGCEEVKEEKERYCKECLKVLRKEVKKDEQ
jgi:hypothetical protein